jgi:hypothetical protein
MRQPSAKVNDQPSRSLGVFFLGLTLRGCEGFSD